MATRKMASFTIKVDCIVAVVTNSWYIPSATEIQNIQIGEHDEVYLYRGNKQLIYSHFVGFEGDGDVVRRVPIPIYMVFPRLFACPTLNTANFKIGEILSSFTCFQFIIIVTFTEFEANVSVVFDDNHLVSENFPIQLTRSH